MMMYNRVVNNYHVCYSKEANIRFSVKYRLVSEQFSKQLRVLSLFTVRVRWWVCVCAAHPGLLDDALVKRFGGSVCGK